MPNVSIIIRTKNEERWVPHCMKMIFAQSYKDFEVILVDNDSSDHTVRVAQRYPIAKTVQISQFKPGLAINEGIRASSGQYIVCISAHCIPVNEDWLSDLLKGFEGDAAVAGVYGRQLPMSFSEPSDKRDLLITFGLDRRVQIKDYFFHNANSMIRREIWNRIPFDETATNIEDRIWGKAVTEAGYKIVYEPTAAVYHHHGIHQDNNPQRARSVVSVIERFEKDVVSGLPDSFKVEKANAVAVLPVLGEAKEIAGKNLLAALIDRLRETKSIKKTYVLSENEAVRRLAEKHGASFLKRPVELISKEKTLEDALRFALDEIERGGDYPEIIVNANYLHPFRPKSLFDELVEDLLYKGLETVFAGYADYQNVWVKDPSGGFSQIGEGLKSREHKQPLYESLYGLGCATASHVIRSGKLVGSRVGILPLNDRLYTIKQVDERSERLIAAILRQMGGTEL